jgi:hypothetical protein
VWGRYICCYKRRYKRRYMEKNKKNNPKGIRLPEDLMKKIKEKEGLKTDQAVINFLLKWYEQTKFPILVTPTLERNEQKYSQSGKTHPEKGSTASAPNPLINKKPRMVVVEELPKELHTERIKEIEKLIFNAEMGITKFDSPLAKKATLHDLKKELSMLCEQMGGCDDPK